MRIVAEERTKQGTGASRRLRNAGKAPGVVYGGAETPQLITLDHNNLWHALRNEAFHSSILELEVAGKTSRVLLRDVQVHPWRQQVLHVDFQRVSATEEITMNVPLHYEGEEESNAVKLDKCLVDYILNEIEIRCLPANLPERIVVDLSGLEQGSTVTLADIQMPEGVSPALRGREAEDIVLVTVVLPRVEEVDDSVEDELAAAEGETPAEGEGEAAEGGSDETASDDGDK